MMHGMGHEVFLYAGEQNEAPCTELVTLYTEAERKAACGGGHFIDAKFGAEQPHFKKLNARAIYEIRKRAQPKDFICLIGGTSHKPIADAIPDLIAVEFGIGYGGSFAKCRVWESYAWMHTCYGTASKGSPNSIDGLWYDAVIPGYFEKETFPFREKKDDYYLYVGRLTDRKGYRLASDVCQKLGKRLIVAGHGTPPDYGEYVGEVDPNRRNELMAGATALFAPTIYLEPFGNIVPEAMLCGTPVITTDFGAFTETNLHGITGFRCRSFSEFVEAVEDVKRLSPKKIRQHAIKNYSLDVIAPQYERYFTRLMTLWTKEGWYWLPDELQARLVSQETRAA